MLDIGTKAARALDWVGPDPTFASVVREIKVRAISQGRDEVRNSERFLFDDGSVIELRYGSNVARVVPHA